MHKLITKSPKSTRKISLKRKSQDSIKSSNDHFDDSAIKFNVNTKTSLIIHN